jgi:hypothetical protein
MHFDSRRLLAIAASATLASLLLTSCGDDKKAKATPTTHAPTSTAPTAPPSPSPEDLAREQILAAYKKMGEVTDEVARNGRVGNQDVSAFMTGQAKVKWAAAGLSLEKDGLKVTGEVQRVANVSTLDLAPPKPAATVLACVDTTDLKIVKADTGAPMNAKPQAPRYVQTATVQMQEGRWLITDFVTDRNRPC